MIADNALPVMDGQIFERVLNLLSLVGADQSCPAATVGMIL